MPIPPKKRRKWPWVVVGVVVLLFLAVAIGGANTAPSTAAAPVRSTAPPGVPSGVDPSTFNPDPAPATPAYAAPVVLGPAKKISARDWQLIAKNPDAHVGERVIVYGQVTQFDAATGTGGFRANVDGVQHKVSYGYADYRTNTILTADDASLIADIVEGDLFKAEVTVAGAKSYDTQIGGHTTAPQLTVTKIEQIGHVG